MADQPTNKPANKPTRGKRSKIDLLPEDIRKKLDMGLRDGSITQKELLEEINDLIRLAGLPEAAELSKSGLNRYASKMEAVGKDLREMREVSEVWVAQLGEKPTGDVTKLILEIGRTQLFKAMMNQAEDSGEAVDIGMIKDAMLAAQRLEQTASLSHKREKDIRKAFAEEAANAAEVVAKSQGLTKDAVQLLKNEILGIA